MSSKTGKKLLQNIGRRIKTLRIDQNMTQLDVAIKSNIDERLIQRLEACETDARITKLQKVAIGFDMSISEFFNFEQ